MIVQYRIVWWDKPSLSHAEEIAFGKRIAAKGKQPFLDEFLESAGPTHSRGETYTRTQVIVGFVILLLMVVSLFMIGMGVVFLVALAMVLGVYFVSVAVSTVRLNLWLDRLAAQYAAHIAKNNGHPT